jgi:hypothetical protein
VPSNRAAHYSFYFASLASFNSWQQNCFGLNDSLRSAREEQAVQRDCEIAELFARLSREAADFAPMAVVGEAIRAPAAPLRQPAPRTLRRPRRQLCPRKGARTWFSRRSDSNEIQTYKKPSSTYVRRDCRTQPATCRPIETIYIHDSARAFHWITTEKEMKKECTCFVHLSREIAAVS